MSRTRKPPRKHRRRRTSDSIVGMSHVTCPTCQHELVQAPDHHPNLCPLCGCILPPTDTVNTRDFSQRRKKWKKRKKKQKTQTSSEQ